MTRADLLVYRRRLPHWRLEGSVYFVTWRLASSQTDLHSKERDKVMSALKHFDNLRYELYAGVVMPDHVHVLVKPLGTRLLQEIIHSWKSFTAHTLRRDCGRDSPLWQDEYLDRIVRNEKEFLEKAQYILNNPLKILPERQEYQWVWFKEDLDL